MTIEEFYNQQGETAFIDKVASVLNIDPTSIRVVGIKIGSVIIDFEIDAKTQNQT